MTFSDVLTVIGAGIGALVLLAMAITPLLADLDPSPARRRVTRDRPVRIPVPRTPTDAARAVPSATHCS